MSILVIGLSGVTNGGKSTLANYLKKVLPNGTRLIKQDDYFLPENSPLHVPSPGNINHHNWDIITSLDMDTMVKDIKYAQGEIIRNLQPLSLPTNNINTREDFSKIIDQDCVNKILDPLERIKKIKGIIIIEGFTIYDDDRIRGMTQLKFFVTLSQKECFLRRKNRVYEPPDPEGYFEACVWPMYEAYFARMKKQTDIIYFDGTERIEKIFFSILNKIVAVASSL